jgi:hypothetical protein
MLLGLLIGIPAVFFFLIVASDQARRIYGRTHQLELTPRWDRLVLVSLAGMFACALLMYLFLPH